MRIITKIEEMKEYSQNARSQGKRIGFVPTMGYLHEGHLSLVRAAREECDEVIVSIFVNPTQFSPGEDLEKYPRDIERDKALLDEESVDVIFAPNPEEMYPEGLVAEVKVDESLTQGLCGRSRPGHFEGVATVVAKLFSIISPDKSYFGQKDAQQALVVKRMTGDLDISVEIRIMPIIREEDGLAMSSRNTYLSEEERSQAKNLYRALKKSKKIISEGELTSSNIKKEMESVISEGVDTRLDYIEVVDADTLASLDSVKSNTLIAVAAFVGKTRLIDNIVIERI
ncbi:pantoate--beta-alanine ligase [Candidatus Omnitrophota bacterium]